MAIFKCKMCGGDLDVTEGVNIVECEYCGTKQTVPYADNEKKVNLFNRANRLRIGGEFDKAAGIYENIIAEFPEEAEAYWGLCLCNYGIEYVDDPATAKKIPTCHRAAFESLQKDENFNLALEYADVVAQKIYRDEAREIDRIMSEILAVSKNEKPYDVFICYKETDEKGERTVDSVLAHDIYDALTAKGLKVFFARITLEDKLGMQYEPYIFAALNSAKVMLSIGTKYEYFHAVWVKNEWSRFLKLMAKDKSKVLIPCFKDIDAYDMPDEFKGLQAQDLGKLGAVQDIVRGVEKILGSNLRVEKRFINEPVNSNQSSNALNLVRLGFLDYNSDDEIKAKEQFRRALEFDANCIPAYIGLCLLKSTASKEKEAYFDIVIKNAPEITEEEKNIIPEKNIMEYILFFLEYTSESRVEYFLKTGSWAETVFTFDVDGIECRGTLLNYAASKVRNLKAIELLLKLGADPNKSVRIQGDGNKYSALYDAICITKDIEMVKLLLEAGADPNRMEKLKTANGKPFSKSMLTYAIIEAKSLEMVRLLLEHGADPNRANRTMANGNEYSALSDAIWVAKNIKMVKFLLEAGADPNRTENLKNENGDVFSKSMLSRAIGEAKSPEMVRLLLEHGADPNKAVRKRSNGEEYSALSDAIWFVNDIEMVKLLLEAGADPNRIENLKDEKGKPFSKSMLSYAITDTKSTKMVCLLIKHGADVNKAIGIRVDGSETSALCEAICGAKDIEMVKILLEAGADPNRIENLKNEAGKPYSKSLLSYAIVDAKNPGMVRSLLKHGADVNKAVRTTVNGSEYSALSDAIGIAKNTAMVELLLEAGADPNRIENLKDEAGKPFSQSMLSYAIIDAKSPIMVRLLLENDADANKAVRTTVNGTEYSALSDAIWNAKDTEMVKLLLEAGAEPNRIENRTDGNGNQIRDSLLSYAIVDAESKEMVELLLEHGADPNRAIRICADGDEYSALSDAIWNVKNVEMVKLLLEAGADPNRIENLKYESGNYWSHSMLSYAIVVAESKEMVNLLLQHGASWDAKISLKGVTKTVRKYPFDRKCRLSSNFITFLGIKGWKGSLF